MIRSQVAQHGIAGEASRILVIADSGTAERFQSKMKIDSKKIVRTQDGGRSREGSRQESGMDTQGRSKFCGASHPSQAGMHHGRRGCGRGH